MTQDKSRTSDFRAQTPQQLRQAARDHRATVLQTIADLELARREAAGDKPRVSRIEDDIRELRRHLIR